MRVINLVDRLDRVNYGIWNAAIATAAALRDAHGIESEIWFPAATRQAKDAELNGARPRPLERLDAAGLREVSTAAGLDPARDLVISHGCWQYPTRWGRALKRRGHRWIGVPHGMLEAWSVSQKRLRKAVYFHLLEKPALKQADRVRAVGKPEFEKLQAVFGERTVWIPNGVPEVPEAQLRPEGGHFLFMARLHHKKGVLPLVEGWNASSLRNREGFQLQIAGPDDGGFADLKAFLDRHPDLRNVTYLGPVYGEEKARLLNRSHFYILPSFSEGFPTSVLEAMAAGLIPVISRGCNFPDALEAPIGIEVSPNPEAVREALEVAAGLDPAERTRRAEAARSLIRDHYTYATLAAEQAGLFRSLL